MNPTPPIPAPEGEVPPRRWYGVRKNGTDWFAPTDKFGGTEYVSKQEVEQLLSAEKQRGLRAVEEAKLEGRIAALKDAFVSRLGDGRPNEQKPWQVLLREAESALAASRAAKEPS